MINPIERKYVVIFADDDPDTLNMLYHLGLSAGWDVETAQTGQELLKTVEDRCKGPNQPVDIVVTDVSFFKDGIPGMSGIAAGRKIAEVYPNLPVLFLTGYDGILTRENVLSVVPNDDYYLVKPVDPLLLIRRIEYLIKFTHRGYDGPERRRTSVNRTDFCRRSSDAHLGVPRVLKVMMTQYMM